MAVKAINDAARPLPSGGRPGGTTGFMSWDSLEESIRDGGALRRSEKITCFVVEELGLSFVVEQK